MNTKYASAVRSARLPQSARVVPILVLILSFAVGSLTFGGAAGGAAAAMAPPPPVAAPLKPDWVEAMLDARATALRSLLDAHDLASAAHRLQPGEPAQRMRAPLKPDWVEALLDARATALRSLLEAHDLEPAAGTLR
jgi:hypothetical protein